MSMEIEIHRGLNDRHVVGFHSFFEDENFVYVILELCRRRVSHDQNTFEFLLRIICKHSVNDKQPRETLI